MMKHMQQTPVKVRRKFDETFKRESVQHWLQSGQSAEVIAQELGFKANRLYAWKQQGFAPAVARGGATAGAKPGSLADLPQAGVGVSRHLPNSGPGSRPNLRLHRSVLQSPARPQCA
jgi:hypothetical protein